jgi:hypothetical protein
MRVFSLLGALVVLLMLPQAASAESNAVVAFLDTGINPYHEVYRDSSPRASQHPSTYLPSFPKDAEALHLSFGILDYADAVAADCERVWKKIVPGKLYWFPGTRIVGAVSFMVDQTGFDCSSGDSYNARILDNNGHGTMVSSRAASKHYGACRDCLIVAAHWSSTLGSRDEAMAALRWTAANSHWIDAQSHSWGPIAPFWDPAVGENVELAGIAGADPEFVRVVEMTSQRNLAFWATGNGTAFRAGVLGHPTLLSPHLTPSAIGVGGHDSGHVTTWPGFPPHLVSDACGSWAAHPDDTAQSGDSVGSGTSAATPFVAGGAAKILKDARTLLGDPRVGVHGGAVARGPAGLVPSGPLADGVLTLAEWRELLYKTATARPKAQFEDGPPCLDPVYGPTPAKWEDVPESYPEYTSIGYGAVDDPATALAGQVLRGTVPMPDRARTDEFFARDAELRAALHEHFSEGQTEPAPPEVPEDGPSPAPDAGASAPPVAGPAAVVKPARAKRARVKFGALARVRGAKGCAPRSGLRIRLLRSPRSAAVSIGRTVTKPFPAGGRDVRVRPLPKGRFVVRLVVVDEKGRVLEARRAFRSCR